MTAKIKPSWFNEHTAADWKFVCVTATGVTVGVHPLAVSLSEVVEQYPDAVELSADNIRDGRHVEII